MKKIAGRKPKYKVKVFQMNVRIADEESRIKIRQLEKRLLRQYEK